MKLPNPSPSWATIITGIIGFIGLVTVALIGRNQRARPIIISAVLIMVIFLLVALFIGPRDEGNKDPTFQPGTPIPTTIVDVNALQTLETGTVTQVWIDSGTETPTPTAATTLEPLQAAWIPGLHNPDWTPFSQKFDGVEMVLVRVGCFKMGNDDQNAEDDEKPIHTVCFERPFWIDRTEVTNAQFTVFSESQTITPPFPGDDRPLVQVTWREADAFCKSRGARLPTEAEWEYAARGPDGLIYPWGNEWNPNQVVWSGNSNSQTTNVGSRSDKGSWVGALDMSGNVWEWVADWYDANYYGTLPKDVVDPKGPELHDLGEYRVLRGGSWLDSARESFQTWNRFWANPDIPGSGRGFRCARSF